MGFDVARPSLPPTTQQSLTTELIPLPYCWSHSPDTLDMQYQHSILIDACPPVFMHTWSNQTRSQFDYITPLAALKVCFEKLLLEGLFGRAGLLIN